MSRSVHRGGTPPASPHAGHRPYRLRRPRGGTGILWPGVPHPVLAAAVFECTCRPAWDWGAAARV